MQWQVFQSLYGHIIPVMLASMDTLIAASAAWIEPVIKNGLLVYVPARFLWMALRGNGEPISELEVMLVTGSLALMIATYVQQWYVPLVRDFFLVTLSRELSAVMSGAINTQAVTGSSFDEQWNKAYLMGLSVFRALPWGISSAGLVLVVVLFWLCAGISVFIAFGVFMRATMTLILMVSIGPLCCGLFVFPLTRSYAVGFLNTLMSAVVLQVLSVALLSITLGGTSVALKEIATSAQIGSFASVGNEIGQIQSLIGAAILLGLSGWVSYQLPGLASSITHGFAGVGHLPTIHHKIADWMSGGGGSGSLQGGSSGGTGANYGAAGVSDVPFTYGGGQQASAGGAGMPIQIPRLQAPGIAMP